MSITPEDIINQKSIEKIYCVDCKHFFTVDFGNPQALLYIMSGAIEQCHHSSNIKKEDKWDKERRTIITHPREKNKNNDCKFFEVIEPDRNFFQRLKDRFFNFVGKLCIKNSQ